MVDGWTVKLCVRPEGAHRPFHQRIGPMRLTLRKARFTPRTGGKVTGDYFLYYSDDGRQFRSRAEIARYFRLSAQEAYKMARQMATTSRCLSCGIGIRPATVVCACDPQRAETRQQRTQAPTPDRDARRAMPCVATCTIHIVPAGPRLRTSRGRRRFSCERESSAARAAPHQSGAERDMRMQTRRRRRNRRNCLRAKRRRLLAPRCARQSNGGLTTPPAAPHHRPNGLLAPS